MKLIRLAAVLLALTIAQPVAAAPAHYTFDKAHTSIVFYIDHLGFSKSTGRFLDFDGHFMFDEENPASSSVEVTIPTASLEMHDERWNDHMKNEDFFNVGKFPEMTFKSTNIEVLSGDTANITGDLTLLGVTKPVTLAVTHNKSADRRGSYVSGFSATTTIKRSEFGMAYGVPMVGDDVQVIIEVEGVRTETEAPEAP